ncbi:RNA-directed DNA polymerase, eukaryota, reverse transcriptase zinc-binding domain protein, partial [Tanacetum coccineum]
MLGCSPTREKEHGRDKLCVSNRLSKWKIKTLSVGGRLTLIKSVLTSLPLYHMSLYKAPLGVLRDLESLRRKFFNGADINEKRFSMISWNKILASKQKGGLGVSSFFALNRSLLFKWVWRFLSQDASLWHRLIAVLYGNRSPFVHTGSVSSLSPWNCILKELNSLSAKGINLLALLKKKVGNGANTLFWEDCWINDVPLSRSFPRLYALELKKGITVADKLIDASFVASFRRNPRGGVEEEQLHHLVELVGSISLSPSNDRWAWLLGSSGEFSVHSARTFIDDILLPFVGDVTRWVKVVPIKVNILAWKVCLDKLPTRLNLSLRGIDIPSIICPNCGLAGESCSHLFYSCNLARTLWRKIARWWEIDIPDFSCYEEWIAWFKTTRFSKAQKEMLEGVFYVMWWMIWKFRNQVLFGSSHPRMELLFDDIVSYSFTWCSNRKNCLFCILFPVPLLPRALRNRSDYIDIPSTQHRSSKGSQRPIKARKPGSFRKWIPIRRDLTGQKWSATIVINMVTLQENVGLQEISITEEKRISYQAKEEHPINFVLMAHTSSGSSSSSNSEVDSYSKLCVEAYATLKEKYDNFSSDYKKSQFNLVSYKAESQIFDKFKTGLGYNAASSTTASPAVESFVNTLEILENQEHNKSKSDMGYHEVPPPFTGNFIPHKPDLTFMDKIVESENLDVTTV